MVGQQPLLECSFLIPVRRDRNLSDGRAHAPKAWKWLQAELLVFGGGTRDLVLQEGWYREPDTGERVTDRSQRYTVALKRRRLGRLRRILSQACLVFKQKCIYLSIAGHVEFIRGPNDES